jgi:glycosyltransferase involved in cell wall biosynthesis
MKIVYIVSGAGGMYCGSCLHANGLASALSRQGADILVAPAYTPIRTDEDNVSGDHLVFGGLNVYLQHKWGLFRRAPGFVNRLFDSPWMAKRLGKIDSSVRPEKLGPMTVSMLSGEEGRLSRELDKLVDWLAEEAKPDIVHLSNVMLVGMARKIRERLGVPVVCSLTGEDAFLEKLSEPHYGKARKLLRERAADLDGLIALCGYYADFMSGYLHVPRERCEVIHPGLDLTHYEEVDIKRPESNAEGKGDPVIGFLSRIDPDKGLHLLVDAWLRLIERPEFQNVRLRAAGYLARSDRKYLDKLLYKASQVAGEGRFEYIGSPDLAGKIEFLRSLDVMSIPSLIPESKGLPVLEAMAVGTPVVLPDHGVFRELVKGSGGGLTYKSSDVEQLTERLAELLLDPAKAKRLGAAGREAVQNRFHDQRMAERTLAFYDKVCKR